MCFWKFEYSFQFRSNFVRKSRKPENLEIRNAISHRRRIFNNQCADFLANKGCAEQKKICFQEFSSFPSVEGSVYVRVGIPNLRCKKW